MLPLKKTTNQLSFFNGNSSGEEGENWGEPE